MNDKPSGKLNELLLAYTECGQTSGPLAARRLLIDLMHVAEANCWSWYEIQFNADRTFEEESEKRRRAGRDYVDEEVIRLDADGTVIQWDDDNALEYNSGLGLREFGPLTPAERERLLAQGIELFPENVADGGLGATEEPPA